jgi:cytochrome c oxidase cbb3-type subunit 4
MSYETVATFSQVASLLLFVLMFVVVLVYALWPANGPRFEAAQRRALELDQKLDATTRTNHKTGGRA